jgi:anti-sigma regulatory factor (Ser/Thr protein kinase)
MLTTTTNFQAEIESLDSMMRWVRACLAPLTLPQADLHKIELSMEEALVNVIRHAYHRAKGPIEIAFYHIPGQSIEFIIKDKGIPFNPLLEIQTVPHESTLEERKEGGLGILLMLEYMDEVRYQRQDAFNFLTLVKHL